MKYLRSTTTKAYVVRGKCVPKVTDRSYLSLTDDEFITWQKQPVIKSLIDNGVLFVTDKRPTTAQESAEEKAAALQAELETINMNREAIREEAVAELRAEAQAALAEKDAEIEALKARLLAVSSSAEE